MQIIFAYEAKLQSFYDTACIKYLSTMYVGPEFDSSITLTPRPQQIARTAENVVLQIELSFRFEVIWLFIYA